PSIAVPSRMHSYPAACAASSTARKTSAGRVASAKEGGAKTASPGFGVSLTGGASARLTSGGGAGRWGGTRGRAPVGGGPSGARGGARGKGGGGADHRRMIPRHGGDADGDKARGICMLRKPPAFDAGEMLAHRVDLDDRGAASEQRARCCLLVRERKAGGGRDPVGRSAAGNEHQNQILGAGGIGGGERSDRGGKPGRIWHRVARLDDANEARRTAVAATGDRETADAAFWYATRVEIVAFGDLGHGACGLAGRQNDQASGRGRRQMRRQAALGVRCGHRRAEQPFGNGARRCGQGSNSGAVERPPGA